MRRFRNLAFPALAALPLAACGNPSSDIGRGADSTRQIAFDPAGSEVDAYSGSSLGSAWFDGFRVRGRSNSRMRATREEVDAYLHGRGREKFVYGRAQHEW